MNKFKKNIKKSKKIKKKLIKTIKNKSTSVKCKNFCKKDYIPENTKNIKKIFKRFNVSFKRRTKKENNFSYNTCKKTFCNKKCDGYNFFGNKQKQIDFNKTIKNGFSNSLSKDKVEILKKKGALSGCIELLDYDIFHK